MTFTAMQGDREEFEMERRFPLDFAVTAEIVLASSLRNHTTFGLVDGEPWSSAPPWTFDWSSGAPTRAPTKRFREDAVRISRRAFERTVAWHRTVVRLRMGWDCLMLMLEPMKALISGASVAVICVLAVAFMPVVMILMPAWLVLQRVAGPVQEKSERNPEDEAWALAWVVTKAELARSMAPYKRDW